MKVPIAPTQYSEFRCCTPLPRFLSAAERPSGSLSNPVPQILMLSTCLDDLLTISMGLFVSSHRDDAPQAVAAVVRQMGAAAKRGEIRRAERRHHIELEAGGAERLSLCCYLQTNHPMRFQQRFTAEEYPSTTTDSRHGGVLPEMDPSGTV